MQADISRKIEKIGREYRLLVFQDHRNRKHIKSMDGRKRLGSKDLKEHQQFKSKLLKDLSVKYGISHYYLRKIFL